MCYSKGNSCLLSNEAVPPLTPLPVTSKTSHQTSEGFQQCPPTAVPVCGCKSPGSPGSPAWALTAPRVAQGHCASRSCPSSCSECVSIHVQQYKAPPTIDYHSCCGAFPFGHNVFCDTGVIGGVRKPGLLDDQVVINGDVKVSVFHRIDHLFILQPLHLGVSKGQRGGSESASSHTNMDRHSMCDYIAHPRKHYKPRHVTKDSPDERLQVKQNTRAETQENTLCSYPFLQVPFCPTHPHNSCLALP